MSNGTLLQRQNELLRFLTSPDVIFGVADFQCAMDDPFLGRLKLPHLRLEAEMSFEKRMRSIERLLSRTFALLKKDIALLSRKFAAVCPPHSHLGYANAQCFVGFLMQHWKSVPPNPPYLPEIAEVELALARAQTHRRSCTDRESQTAPYPSSKAQLQSPSHVEVFSLTFDLRALFSRGGAEPGARGTEVPRRPNHLAMTLSPGTLVPRMVPISQEVAVLLSFWRGSETGATILRSLHNRREFARLFDWMRAAGLIETCFIGESDAG